MEIFDLVYKITSFLIIPLIWWIKELIRKIDSNGSSISGLYAKLERLEEHQAREHGTIESRMGKLEEQHGRQDSILEVLRFAANNKEDKL